MPYVALEKLVDGEHGSIYKMVILASKRALEIAEGQPKLVTDISSAAKPSTIALYEIAEGKVQWKKAKVKD
jgi:DNA-directed RNA polymerase subunit omega